jgi:hypothetical protein
VVGGWRSRRTSSAAPSERLGFDVSSDWRVAIPTWRAVDVTREIDLVEEVARPRPEDPFTLPLRSAMFGTLALDQRLRRLVEDVLVGAGFPEAYTLSLAAADPDEKALRLPDPLTSEHAVLRTTLLDGLVAAARHNVNMGNEAIRLFEIARVYLPSGEELPEERRRVTGIAEGGFAVARGAVETLFAALKVEPGFERTTAPSSTRARRWRTYRPAGSASSIPEHARRGGEHFELDLETLLELLPRADRLRGRHLPPRARRTSPSRRGRGHVGRGPRAAPPARRPPGWSLRDMHVSTSTAARDSRAESRSPSTPSSARPSERSRRGSRASSGRRSWPRWERSSRRSSRMSPQADTVVSLIPALNEEESLPGVLDEPAASFPAR